jgi:adenosylhomocysteine nucleosidase
MPSSAERQVAIVAALKREVECLIRGAKRVDRAHAGHMFRFFERGRKVVVCGGIGAEAARRAAEAAIELYHPVVLHSVGFAGALQPGLPVGEIFVPALVIDARDGSRTTIEEGSGVLVTFMNVAGVKQKMSLGEAYAAQAVDMEAAAVAAAAHAHGIAFRATKVISDGFDFEMPDMGGFIDPQGQFRSASFAVHIALRPWLWPRTILLARNSSKAANALAKYLNERLDLSNNAVEAKTI